MINGKLVIDAVTHAFDARPELASQDAGYEYGLQIHTGIWAFQHQVLDDPFRVTRDEWFHRMSPDALESAMFLESPTDLAWYHSIPARGFWPDLSPAEVGLEVCRRRPTRMFMYGAISPLEGAKALDDLERQVEDWHIDGVKLYPVDFVNGRLHPWSMSDEELFYPVLERCRALGVKVIAVHKSIPMGNAPTGPFRPDDIESPAADFPDLNFEIVHGGFTFVEETAFQLARFPNIYVNLEATSGLLLHAPMRFARILGELLKWGDSRKIVWGTGATAIHPAPLVEAFEAFEMPDVLVQGEGFPSLTEEIRRDIFANNFVRLHNLDIAALTAAIDGDDISKALVEGFAPPWSGLRKPANHN
jgi:uncharacterized protein